jgi:hypothetical protein
MVIGENKYALVGCNLPLPSQKSKPVHQRPSSQSKPAGTAHERVASLHLFHFQPKKIVDFELEKLLK